MAGALTPESGNPDIRPGEKPDELVVFDHGFVRLDDCMASDLSVVNSARVSFAVRREVMEEKDRGLIRFLMRERHGTPFEHNSFRFHIRTPIFVAREWFRHRVGCLTGDTVITFVNVNGSAPKKLTKTLDELWEMYSRGDAWRVREMHLRVLDESDNEFTSGHIDEVVDSSVRPVYRLALADGRQITATEEHRLLTDRGWRTLSAAVGLAGAGGEATMTRAPSLMVNGVQSTLGLGPDVRSAHFSPQTSGRAVKSRLTAHAVPVVALEYVGLRQTYDLCVQGPWHNFLANGIVVHNSFNEESARYHKLEGDFYLPTLNAVRGQVGKPGSYSFEPVDEQLASETIDTFKRIYEQLYDEYQSLVDKGVAKELARALLPVGIYTQFYWTLNARSLMNFLSLRNAPNAQYEIRTYAEAVERLFARHMPITYECFVEFGRRSP